MNVKVVKPITVVKPKTLAKPVAPKVVTLSAPKKIKAVKVQ